MPKKFEGSQNREEELLQQIETPVEKTEVELSPEVVEKIMAKVQDIDKKGTAYHALDDPELETSLSQGLLGQELDHEGRETKFGKDWAKKVRETKKGFVHFNIVGRSRDTANKFETEISQSYYFKNNPGKIAILFDIDKYKEVTPLFRPPEARSKTFRAHGSGYGRNTKGEDIFAPIEEYRGQYGPPWYEEQGFETEKGTPMPETEYGFVLSHRVAPRLFRGIVVLPSREKNDEEIREELQRKRQEYEEGVREGYIDKEKRPFDKQKEIEKIKKHKVENRSYLSCVQNVVKQMKKVYDKEPEKMLPVYSIRGDLQWPKYMDYEEVKRFVAERDAKEETDKKK